MHAATDLVKVCDRADARLTKLYMMARSIRVPVTSPDDEVSAFILIESANAWSVFARSYYISCCCGARNAAGQRISHHDPRIVDERSALVHAVRVLKPRAIPTPTPAGWYPAPLQEPRWLSRDTLARLARNLRTSNLGQIEAAVAAVTPAFDDLPTVRNFFAHRSYHTAESVRSVARRYSISPQVRPKHVCHQIPPTLPHSLLADWIFDIREVIRLLR
jgi:hypothetical protein